jgi:transposase
LNYFAAQDFHSGRIFYAFYDWKNAFIVQDFFEKLLREIPDKILYVVLDCWSAHRAAVLQVFADLHQRLKLIFLPTNASWMNVVERFFSQVERFVLRNSNFQSIQELMGALASFAPFGALI